MDQSMNIRDQICSNPYIMRQIMRKLDIRSLSNSHIVSKDFYDLSADEYEKRKDLIHLYLLNSEVNEEELKQQYQRLYDSFRYYCRNWINIRPKHVLVLIGGYMKTIDYRLKDNSLKQICEYLPKGCQITYLDVGHTVLTSSIRFKSL